MVQAQLSLKPPTYIIKVDGSKVTIDNGKQTNVVSCDGKEFVYESSSTGPAVTTAMIVGGKFVMEHQGIDEVPEGMTTSRFVENGLLVQEITHKGKNVTW